MNKYIPVSDLAETPPRLRSLLSFWESVAADGKKPTRAALTPFALQPWLGHIDIYRTERDGADFRLVLNGTIVVEKTGEDWTGRTAQDVDNKYKLTLLADLQDVYARKVPRVDRITLFQKEHVTCYRLLLPVWEEGADDKIREIFLALFWKDDPLDDSVAFLKLETGT